MGVFPKQPQCLHRPQGLPHARGGVSPRTNAPRGSKMSSPRSWGCFCPASFGAARHLVFPTLVGVFLAFSQDVKDLLRLPHARGGVSHACPSSPSTSTSSPRSWGCFCLDLPQKTYSWVFPTLVGVFPRQQVLNLETRGLPHARGGVSRLHKRGLFPGLSSPRSWGCFLDEGENTMLEAVFPTLVGVFLPRPSAEDL